MYRTKDRIFLTKIKNRLLSRWVRGTTCGFIFKIENNNWICEILIFNFLTYKTTTKVQYWMLNKFGFKTVINKVTAIYHYISKQNVFKSVLKTLIYLFQFSRYYVSCWSGPILDCQKCRIARYTLKTRENRPKNASTLGPNH